MCALGGDFSRTYHKPFGKLEIRTQKVGKSENQKIGKHYNKLTRELLHIKRDFYWKEKKKKRKARKRNEKRKAGKARQRKEK